MLAATASADFSAKVWDAITGDELHHLEHGHIVRTVQFAQQASKFVTGGAELKFIPLCCPDLGDLPCCSAEVVCSCLEWFLRIKDQISCTLLHW